MQLRLNRTIKNKENFMKKISLIMVMLLLVIAVHAEELNEMATFLKSEVSSIYEPIEARVIREWNKGWRQSCWRTFPAM